MHLQCGSYTKEHLAKKDDLTAVLFRSKSDGPNHEDGGEGTNRPPYGSRDQKLSWKAPQRGISDGELLLLRLNEQGHATKRFQLFAK